LPERVIFNDAGAKPFQFVLFVAFRGRELAVASEDLNNARIVASL